MKRTIIFIFATCLSIAVNAQIQTKFWGLELSKLYPSVESARQIIFDKCDYSEVSNNEIHAINGKFGGYHWSYVKFSFYCSLHFKVCYYVTFSDQSKSRDVIKMRFESLTESLINKYGSPSAPKDHYDRVVNMWVEEGTPYSCMLTMEKGTSKGGEEYWYIILSYCDHDYLNLALEEDEDEL